MSNGYFLIFTISLISPDVDTPEVLSQGLRRSARVGRKRQRLTVDSVKDAFQSGVHQRMQKGVADLPEFSDSSAIASPTLQSIPEEVEVGIMTMGWGEGG